MQSIKMVIIQSLITALFITNIVGLDLKNADVNREIITMVSCALKYEDAKFLWGDDLNDPYSERYVNISTNFQNAISSFIKNNQLVITSNSTVIWGKQNDYARVDVVFYVTELSARAQGLSGNLVKFVVDMDKHFKETSYCKQLDPKSFLILTERPEVEHNFVSAKDYLQSDSILAYYTRAPPDHLNWTEGDRQPGSQNYNDSVKIIEDVVAGYTGSFNIPKDVSPVTYFWMCGSNKCASIIYRIPADKIYNSSYFVDFQTNMEYINSLHGVEAKGISITSGRLIHTEPIVFPERATSPKPTITTPTTTTTEAPTTTRKATSEEPTSTPTNVSYPTAINDTRIEIGVKMSIPSTLKNLKELFIKLLKMLGL